VRGQGQGKGQGQGQGQGKGQEKGQGQGKGRGQEPGERVHVAAVALVLSRAKKSSQLPHERSKGSAPYFDKLQNHRCCCCCCWLQLEQAWERAGPEDVLLLPSTRGALAQKQGMLLQLLQQGLRDS